MFSNSDLLSSRIQNFKRMQERRVEFRFSVPCTTPTALLDQVPAIVRRAVADRPKVHLKSLSEYDLVFECVSIIQTPDFNFYMVTHRALALRLRDDVAAEGVRCAVPTHAPRRREYRVDDGVEQVNPPDHFHRNLPPPPLSNPIR